VETVCNQYMANSKPKNVANGKLSRMLTDPNNDAAAAFVEELAYLHNALITQAPERMRNGHFFTLGDQNARMIARSSRLVEPFICEALAAVLPKHGPVKLLEIGCGAAAYIRSAALRNPELTALGIELQAEAAALATENIANWGLASRVSIEIGDIRKRSTDATFDLATLHQNIYYFPVVERADLLSHVRSFLKKGGHVLLTTICQGRGSTAAILDLWGAMTADCGRLPEPTEMVAQIEKAGFAGVTAKRLIPGESFYSFVGTNH
jgi:SAM-dependent methyltransferase